MLKDKCLEDVKMAAFRHGKMKFNNLGSSTYFSQKSLEKYVQNAASERSECNFSFPWYSYKFNVKLAKFPKINDNEI